MMRRCLPSGSERWWSVLVAAKAHGSGTSKTRAGWRPEPHPQNVEGWTCVQNETAPYISSYHAPTFPRTSVATGSTSLKDPRQTLFEDGNPLPAGFTLAYDDDGDVYFIECAALPSLLLFLPALCLSVSLSLFPSLDLSVCLCLSLNISVHLSFYF